MIVPLLLAAALVPPGEFPTGTLAEAVATTSDATQTYTLYLPAGYPGDRRWPLLLVFDPRGRARLAAELFRPAAEQFGWIVVSSADTRSDGPMEPNLKALRALWAEAHLRFVSDPRRIYVAGFSGGAHLGWMLAESTRRLAGVIASGGRVIDEVERGTAVFASFAAAGDVDFNHRGTREADRLLAARGGPHRLEFFSGGHQWVPESLASHAVAWMELVAMRQGLRPADSELVEQLYAEDSAAAATFERSGDALAAMRRWDSVARTFAGLRDTTEARRRADELGAGKPVAAALRAEQRCDEFEDERLAAAFGELARIAAPGRPPTVGRVTSAIGIASLHRRASEPGCAGLAARRVLETTATQAGFYVTRDLFAAERWDAAAVALEVAIEAKPESSPLWYNLACARARSGQPAKALEALQRAVDAGYRDLAHLESDPDLEAIRGEPGNRMLVESLRR